MLDTRILIVGNAPLNTIPRGYYNVVFYFANNAHIVNSVNTDNVYGVIQNFTIDAKQWECPKWGKIREQKFFKYKTFFKSNYKTILIGKLVESTAKYKIDFNIIEEVTHKFIVSHVLRNIPFTRLISVLGLRGCVNYLLLLLNLKSTVSGKYRPSSGYFIALYASSIFKNSNIELVGFSDPRKEYIVTSEVVLKNSPHAKVDSLIFNQLKQNR